MGDKKIPEIKSNTGATIQQVTQTGRASRFAIDGQCRPESDPFLPAECAPDYHCGPDELNPEDALREAQAQQECEGYACCPEKADYECEPNV